MIVYLNGNLHLWQKSNHKKYKEIAKCPSPALGKAYEEDKVNSHITVLIGMILSDRVTGNLKQKEMQQKLDSLYSNLQLKKLDQNNSLTDLSLDTIRKALSSNPAQLKILCQDFIYKIYPLLETYKRNAASLQLHGLHDIMLRWQKEYQTDLLSSRVIVVGSKRPEKGMIEMQYFQHLYKELGIVDAQKSNYLIYEVATHEMMSSIKIKSLIDDLGVHAYNKKIRAMMGEEYPVDEADILKDEAPKICPYLSLMNKKLADECIKKPESALVKHSLFSNNQKEEIDRSNHIQANTH